MSEWRVWPVSSMGLVLLFFILPESALYSFSKSRVNHVMDEMVTTEMTYVHDLSEVIEGYLMPLQMRALPFSSIQLASLFGNLVEIRDFHRSAACVCVRACIHVYSNLQSICNTQNVKFHAYSIFHIHFPFAHFRSLYMCVYRCVCMCVCVCNHAAVMAVHVFVLSLDSPESPHFHCPMECGWPNKEVRSRCNITQPKAAVCTYVRACMGKHVQCAVQR